MKKMCYLLTMGLLAGSLTVPVFAASDADSASDKKWVYSNGLKMGYRYRYRLQTI